MMRLLSVAWGLAFLAFFASGPVARADGITKTTGHEKVEARLEELAAIIKTRGRGPAHLEALGAYARLLALPSARSADITIGKYNALLEYAHTLEEKKAVLRNIAGFRHPYTMVLLLPYLPQAPLREVAFNSTLKVARSIRAVYPDAVDDMLKEILRMIPEKKKQKAIHKILKQPVTVEDYILAWQVSGPHACGKSLESAPRDAGELAWQIMPVDLGARNPAALKFEKVLGEGSGVTCLRTWIAASKACEAVLHLKGKGEVMVWLNGERVEVKEFSSCLGKREIRAGMQLKQGENQVIIAVADGKTMCVRLLGAESGALEGVSHFVR